MVSFWHLCVGLHRDHLDTCLGNPRRTFGRCARREEAHDREQVVLHPVLVLAGEKGTSRPVRDSRDSSRESQGDIFFCGKVEANVFLTCHFDCGMLQHGFQHSTQNKSGFQHAPKTPRIQVLKFEKPGCTRSCLPKFRNAAGPGVLGIHENQELFR